MELSKALSWYKGKYQPEVIVYFIHEGQPSRISGCMNSFSDQGITVDRTDIPAKDIQEIELTWHGTQFSGYDMGELDGTGLEGTPLNPVTYRHHVTRRQNEEWDCKEL